MGERIRWTCYTDLSMRAVLTPDIPPLKNKEIYIQGTKDNRYHIVIKMFGEIEKFDFDTKGLFSISSFYVRKNKFYIFSKNYKNISVIKETCRKLIRGSSYE